MPTVDAWFWEFTGRHTARFPRPDWPPVEAEFWEGVKSLFVRHGVAEADADAASVALMESPPPFVDRHPEALLNLVRAGWKSARHEAAGVSGRDEAHALSRGCPECGGDGIAVRFRRRSLGDLRPGGRPVLPSVTLWCVCPMGRWVRQAHLAGPAESREASRGFLDLADHPWLQGDSAAPYHRPPTRAELGEDAPPPPDVFGGETEPPAMWAAFRRYAAALASRRRVAPSGPDRRPPWPVLAGDPILAREPAFAPRPRGDDPGPTPAAENAAF